MSGRASARWEMLIGPSAATLENRRHEQGWEGLPMRVLFVPAIARSQVYLMTPLAWAMRTAGHQVRVACQPDLAEHIASIGLTPAPVGRPMPGLKKDMEEAEPKQDPIAPVTDPRTREKAEQSQYGWGDPAGLMDHLTSDFFKLLTPDSLIDDLVDYAQRWRPDLIIWNTLAFAGPVAARVSGAAHARMPWAVDTWLRCARAIVRRAPSATRARWRTRWSNGCRRSSSATARTSTKRWCSGSGPFDPAPPSISTRPTPACTTSRYARCPSTARPRFRTGCTAAHPQAGLPDARLLEPRGPAGVEASPRELLEAVADLDVEVIATFNERQLGGTADLPDNVRVVDFVPLGVLLPSCSAIVHHGGPGTFATALEHGVPQLIVNGVYWHTKWWGSVSMANGLEDRGAGVHVPSRRQPDRGKAA